MLFKEDYIDICKTQEEIQKELQNNCRIEKSKIEDIDMIIVGHFHNCVSFEMRLTQNIFPIPLWDNTNNIGHILSVLVDILDKSRDDRQTLREALIDTPIRIVFDSDKDWNGRVVAIGHYHKDVFFFIEDLMRFKGRGK